MLSEAERECLFGGPTLKFVCSLSARMMLSEAWRDRHAALMAISAISEGSFLYHRIIFSSPATPNENKELNPNLEFRARRKRQSKPKSPTALAPGQSRAAWEPPQHKNLLGLQFTFSQEHISEFLPLGAGRRLILLLVANELRGSIDGEHMSPLIKCLILDGKQH
ncbi:importin subunit beta-3 [Ciborinia camelliae]|nr:importin subunit beta-3 [Ciborinia camelliae]